MSHFFLKKVLDFVFPMLYSDGLLCDRRKDMKDKDVKRSAYWIVEAWTNENKPVFRGQFLSFDMAWDKYYSFKNKANVSLQRKFKETKIA
jgi:hypothetical protein